MEATRWLIDEFAPELKQDFDGVLNDLPEEERLKYRRGFLYGKIFEHGHHLLFEGNGKPALDYLVNDKKYDRNLLKDSEFMTWNPSTDWKKWLTQQFPSLKKEIDELPLAGGPSDQFKVALPFRDQDNTIIGFVIRHHTSAGLPLPNGSYLRWTSTAGLSKNALYGLSRVKKPGTAIIVEGYPDAEYFRVLGMQNVLALGTVGFSDSYLEGLEAKNIDRIVLSLDNDAKSQAGLKSMIEITKKLAGTNVRVYVVDPTRLAPVKDPDELVRTKGLAAFQALVDSAEPAATWFPKLTLAQIKKTDTVKWDEAVASVVNYAGLLADPGDAVLVVDLLRNTYGISEFELEEKLEIEREKTHEQEISLRLKVLAENVKHVSGVGNTEKALVMLERETSKLIVAFRQGMPEKAVPLIDFLGAKQADDAKRLANQMLGFELKEFPDVTNAMDGIQPGLILIGADPNTGKTMLLVNLAIDLLNSNDRARVLFYTLDDTRGTIVNRFLAKLSEIPINSVQTQQNDVNAQKKLDAAYGWLKDMARERLDVVEFSDGLTMNAIRERVRTVAKRKDVVVLIDGIYNIPLEGSFDSIREENIARANGLKSIAKSFEIPLIGTAELRKRTQEEANKRQRTLHDLMESVKYAYNADVILLLTPTDDMEKFRTQTEPFVDLTFEKNKLSGYRDTIRLKFRKAVATFEQEGGQSIVANIPQGGPV
jgi:replicative DNA helicase